MTDRFAVCRGVRADGTTSPRPWCGCSVGCETGQHHCVIVEVAGQRYVQFIVRPNGGLWTESIGDVFLEAAFTEDQSCELMSLGWNTPELFRLAAAATTRREYEAAGHDREAAAKAVLTCIDVFGAHPYASW